MRCATYIVAALYGLFAFGCTPQPKISPPQPRSEPAPDRIIFLQNPKALKIDYVYPETLTRQKFQWQNNELEWHIEFYGHRYAYAGCIIRRPFDFTGVKDDTKLKFKLKPAWMAKHLSVALLDSDNRPGRIAVDVSLASRANEDDEGTESIDIPLSEFRAKGVPVADGTNDAESIDTTFDWTDVREIRFSAINVPRRTVIISDLRFVR